MTNKQKILELLEKQDWVCSTNFYSMWIADPRTLLAQMKKRGEVESRWCKTHNHKMKEWKLLKTPTFTISEAEAQKRVKIWVDSFKPKEEVKQSLF